MYSGSEASVKVSKSFVIEADAVKAYDVARDFFLSLGYSEQSAIRPTLLVLKRRGDIQTLSSPKTEDYRISLRVSFNPVGDLRLYSTALLTIRCDYDAKVSGGMAASSDKATLEGEAKRLRSHLMSKGLNMSTATSSTTRSATPSPSAERAASIEKSDAAIQAKLIQHGTDIRAGEDENIEIQIVNVGKEAVLLIKIENILPVGFQLVGKPEGSSFEGMHLVMKRKWLDPLETDEIKIVFKSFRNGAFEIKPKIIWVDKAGHETSYELEPKIVNVLETVLPGRIATGYVDLDSLLFGGIPEKYAVVMASPSSDERELLVKKFLESGAKAGQITFYVAVEPGNGRALAEEFQSNFYLFICNPRADVMIPSLPNVFKLKGVESLTDIDIALTKSFRMLDPSQSGPRRACIEIISDVLLQHHAVITRKWLSGLLPDLKAKGFTTLAVVNPHMHPQEEVQAILGLFEGEIRIYEKETEKGIEKTLRIRKLCNQRYRENELTLNREKLES
jgi:KaiC/GvpD/RAD55 family RecA-like ATPase